MGWGREHDYTNLIYKGDTKRAGQLDRLSRVKGLRVKVRLCRDLSKQLGGGWWKDVNQLNEALALFDAKITPPVPAWELVLSKQSPDRLEVWINLAAKDIRVEDSWRNVMERTGPPAEKPKRARRLGGQSFIRWAT